MNSSKFSTSNRKSKIYYVNEKIYERERDNLVEKYPNSETLRQTHDYERMIDEPLLKS